ncbi:hypothetical protein AM629_04130 [Photorhabdus heterorhabditis]|uniref:Filamentous haemagglutinin FhaB/tRNA nuclease CdiA-like TPS domain-containing protein n=1 Tax=Photorhabdus heterorhabditis TaxID=880156 RepID=A0ABR5KF93_9GAMM|nr:hypothetical protein AM629_04130 [Photorhabdus heterorhabditis]
MSKRNNSASRATSYLLIYLTAIQPLHPAIAAGITPDNPQTQVQSQNNIPVVNIATPNSAGISHNTYQEFNVATQGAILNNATQAAKSQLAGQLNANPNLNGKPAELIINEVTGNGQSQLQGQLEIVGNKANVMIANPNGITCDDCGFINTSGAALTTGKPQFDKQGALEALEVKQGQITIGEEGLDGKTTDYVDILSRATELNGKIQANTLSLTQGTNRISLKDSTVKPIAGEGAKPQLAVDTKALGGMYANKIRLVATEDGVGVNLKELTSNQRDITLNVNGKIELGNIKAKTGLNVIGKEVYIAANIKVQTEQDIILANTTLHNNELWTEEEWQQGLNYFIQRLNWSQGFNGAYGFKGFQQERPLSEVNPHGLNQNCYYSTVAALVNKTTTDLVGETEIMQQDTANLIEIEDLFRAAGVNSKRTNFTHQDAQLRWNETFHFMRNNLHPGQFAGLAYIRPLSQSQNNLFSPSGGHMVVVGRNEAQHLPELIVFDYQSGQTTALYENYPPESQFHERYHVFNRLPTQSRKISGDSWRMLYPKLISNTVQAQNNIGVLGFERNGEMIFQTFSLTNSNLNVFQEGNSIGIQVKPAQLGGLTEPTDSNRRQSYRAWLFE